MSAMHRLAPEQLRLEHPLAWNVYDAGGHLLLRKGFLIERDDQINTLIERGMYVHSAEFTEYATSEVPPRYDPLSLWESIQAHLAYISEALPRDGSLQAEITRLARQTMLLTERSPDLALAAILQLEQRNYPIAHCLHAAVVADMVARSSRWEISERISLVCAALSMNIAMLELQLRLCNQRDPLSVEQRRFIDEHPASGARQLILCGISDDEWLRAVLEHHETPDGTGYPRKVKNPSEMAMLLHTCASAVFCSSCDIKMRISRRHFVENPRNSSLLLWFSPRFDEKSIIFISRNLRETLH
jgi:hypothetical protein